MDYQISTDEAGARMGTCPGQPSLAVMPDGPTRMFVRRGVKLLPAGGQVETAWLVGELDGVRVYVDGDALVLTKRDLYP